MPQTKWKQDFFREVGPIAMRDELASVLGATEDNEPIYYTYQDCIKLAGHACASVSSAFQMTKLALKELYNDEIPLRGDIEVRFAGDRQTGANGPIGQIIQFITGAALETGFHGLAGKYVRANKFVYDQDLESGAGLLVIFKRLDTSASVAAHANPTLIPISAEEKEYSLLMPLVIQGTATRQEQELFYKFWQGKNRKILLEDHPQAFYVEKL